jgi:hypothetical protein
MTVQIYVDPRTFRHPRRGCGCAVSWSPRTNAQLGQAVIMRTPASANLTRRISYLDGNSGNDRSAFRYRTHSDEVSYRRDHPQAWTNIGFRAVRMRRAPSCGGLRPITLRQDAVTFPELDR